MSEYCTTPKRQWIGQDNDDDDVNKTAMYCVVARLGIKGQITADKHDDDNQDHDDDNDDKVD